MSTKVDYMGLCLLEEIRVALFNVEQATIKQASAFSSMIRNYLIKGATGRKDGNQKICILFFLKYIKTHQDKNK